MPGHDVSRYIFKDSEAYGRFRCPVCSLLLNEPVQPSCGHRLCRSCADDMLQDQSAQPAKCRVCDEQFVEEDGTTVSGILVARDMFVLQSWYETLFRCIWPLSECDLLALYNIVSKR